jgi:tetratricopeptide (TPR) repeat protein
MDSPGSIYNKDEVPPLARPASPKPSPLSSNPAALRSVIGTGEQPRFRARRRRRRHREPPDARKNLLVWAVASVLVLVYLGVLAFFWMKKPDAAPAAAKAQEKPADVSTSGPEGDRDAVTVGREIAEKIRSWSAAADLVQQAQSYEARGRLDQAAASLVKALESAPELLEARLALAGIRIQEKKYAEAERLLTEFLAAAPARMDARQALAQVYAAQRLHPAALETARWIIESDPYSTDVHALAAQAYLALDNPAMASEHLKKVIVAQRDNVVAMNLLAQAYTRMGKRGEAIETLNKVLDMDPANSASYYNLAVCYVQQARAAEAVEVLGRAAALFGNGFVAAWARGADFDAVRTNDVFQTFQRQMSEATPEEKTGQDQAPEPGAPRDSASPP